MLLLLLYALAFKVILAAATENGQTTVHNLKGEKNIALQNFLSMKPPVPINMTYIDKSENLLRVPNLKKSFVERKSKNKIQKKSAKRTIQKIIKKNRARKKIYMNQATSTPTNPPSDGDMDNYYAQEDLAQKNENSTTMQVNHKKKSSWHTKVNRNPMPFKKMQSMKDHTRVRRSDDRDDLFILTDLDEIEFLNNDKDKDTDIVNAHVKKYW